MSISLINQNQLQTAQLYILNYVHEYCKNNNIEYFIIGGTLLGSVRHKGFIPWDLDIDIAMTRNNYNKIIKSFNKTEDNRYRLVYYKNDKHHFSPHAKIVMNNSKIEYHNTQLESHLSNHKGIYIDIFPLDNVPTEKKEQYKQEKKIKFYRRLIYFKVSPIFSRGFLFHKLIIKKILRLFMKLISFKFLTKRLDYTMQLHSKNDSGQICSMASHYHYQKQVMDVNIYKPAKLYEFENLKFYGPNNEIAYLERIYGDYMELPPKEKRHDASNFIKNVIYPKWFIDSLEDFDKFIFENKSNE